MPGVVAITCGVARVGADGSLTGTAVIRTSPTFTVAMAPTCSTPAIRLRRSSTSHGMVPVAAAPTGAVARPAAHSAVPCPPSSRQTGDEPIRTKTDQTVRLRVPAGAPSHHLAQRAVGDPDLALCAGGDRGVVRDDDKGQPVGVQLLEEVEHAGGRDSVT